MRLCYYSCQKYVSKAAETVPIAAEEDPIGQPLPSFNLQLLSLLPPSRHSKVSPRRYSSTRYFSWVRVVLQRCIPYIHIPGYSVCLYFQIGFKICIYCTAVQYWLRKFRNTPSSKKKIHYFVLFCEV